MPFIGTQPEVGGYSVLDALTASATASYTLQKSSANFSPSSANQLLVSLNGVIQKPGSSFTVSGSTLTFSSALTSSDSIDFILAMGEPLLVGTPSDGTVNTTQLATNAVSTAKIATNAVTTAKITNANITQAKLASGVAGNGPSFSAYLNSTFSISSATATKLRFDAEEWDSNSCFDTTNYRFTPNVAGYYMVGGHFQPQASYSTGTTTIYKNGSAYRHLHWNQHASNIPSPAPVGGQTLVHMNGSSDYVELYGFLTTGQQIQAQAAWTYFQGHMVRSA